MATLTVKKAPVQTKKKKAPVPTSDAPSLGERLIEAMDEVVAHSRGEDSDVLCYSLPPNATLAQVRTARRAAEKELRVKQAARRARLTVAPLTRQNAVAIRKLLSLGQAGFADFLNVPHALVEAWEDGTKAPKGAALRLLADIRARPDYWRDQLHAATGDAP